MNILEETNAYKVEQCIMYHLKDQNEMSVGSVAADITGVCLDRNFCLLCVCF